MKCVGGPLDGQEYPVERGRNHVQIPELMNYGPTIGFPTTPMVPSNVLVKYHTYTVRTIAAKRPPKTHLNFESGQMFIDPDYDQMQFLAPSDWSDFKAIVHQFTK